MNRFALRSPSGRLTPWWFAAAALAIYVLSFGSQVLLSPPVTGRVGVWAFALVQAGLTWGWYVAHVRRLNDAGRPAGTALGIALVYAIEVILIVIIVALILDSGQPSGEDGRDGGGILQLFAFLYLLALLTGDPAIGAFVYWVLAFMAVLFAPVMIAIGFSIWAATRRRAVPTA